MGLFDSILGDFTGFGDTSLLSDIGNFLGGGGLGSGLEVAQPISGPMVPEIAPTPTMALAPAIKQLTAPILFKIAETLGLKTIPSLTKAMGIIKKLAKMLSPAMTAAALGLTLAELATLMTASAKKKARHMNPANTRALRRSLRRLQSFDRLACRVSNQLAVVGRGRRSVRRRVGKCVACKRIPCVC